MMEMPNTYMKLRYAASVVLHSNQPDYPEKIKLNNVSYHMFS